MWPFPAEPPRWLPDPRRRRLRRLFTLAEETWRARPDLQAAFPDVRADEFWYWLHWWGVEEYPEVRDAVYPLPPADLRERVVGAQATADDYRKGGLVDWRQMLACLRAAGFRPEAASRLLDFGCGCGRLLQYFARYAATTELLGRDVDAQAVRWCQRHLDFASFAVNSREPPLDIPAASVDAVYSFSVFTHLPEAMQERWLREIHRVARPGAAVVLTTLGRNVARIALTGLREDLPCGEELRRDLPRFEASGFAFFPYRSLTFASRRSQEHYDQWDLEAYGLAFVLEEHVRREWGRLFEVVEVRAAPDGWQDYVVLRKPG